jgi:DNA-binding NarL/FixJ family response regulator
VHTKVLIADDHAIVREGLSRILDDEEDIEVVGEAENGRDAVSLAAAREPDVVIMDIAMPELNGAEATRQILAADPDVVIVILSMHATSEYVYRALEAGAKAFVVKEAAGAEVVDAVRAVRVGRRYFSQKVQDLMVQGYIDRRLAEGDEGPLGRLSPRERQVLQLVVEGKSSKEIASTIHLSPKTVETYRSRLMEKLGIHDVPSLVKFAIEHGLTTSE